MARLILVADDSPTIQKRAQWIFQGEGFEVETVSNGVAAIKKLPKLQPILVLADVSMPGKDGYEVCDYVKTSPDLHHIPVLLVASDQEPYDERRGAQVGADGVIRKPFAPHELIALVAELAPLGESPASRPPSSDALVASSPVASAEVLPMDDERESARRNRQQDLAAPLPGETFAEPPLNGLRAAPEPLLDIPLHPSAEAALQISAQSSPEPRLEGPPEYVFAGLSEPTLEIPSEAPPELALELLIEPTHEPLLEAAPEPTPATAESIVGTDLEAAPGQASVGSEPAVESALPSAMEFAPETVHPAAEATLETPPDVPVEEPPLAAEPLLVEEQVEPLLPPDLSPELVELPADRPMPFHALAETAEAVLRVEVAAASPVPAPRLSVEENLLNPMAVTSLDSSSLTEAAHGHVHIAPPEAEAASAPELGVDQPSEAAVAAPTEVDPRLVYAIVHKAVAKMSPPILPIEVVEELNRRLTAEITAELNAESSQASFRRDVNGGAKESV